MAKTSKVTKKRVVKIEATGMAFVNILARFSILGRVGVLVLNRFRQGIIGCPALAFADA